MNIIFDQDKFNDLFDGLTDKDQVSNIDAKAYHIINTIVDYYDCMGSFVNTLNHESISAALKMLDDENLDKIEDVNGTENAIALLSNIRDRKKPHKSDLF